ncbi:MBL fold metallo-hydrolase [Thalassobacillus sp. CUG 92003]|uniref:MBL fold metallo-hydrolase n=1 Tax=Thalassobacillus sp. CUG 92003 TaxID=2736641 RepID=UPI0015E7C37A|nr:MBL fold metallo-hydrolase [Thalassobacillus sp. CUG 92003]
MKLTVVGFWGAYPDQNGATSSYLLEKNGWKVLIDCGSGCLSRLQQFTDVTDLDAVILSHYHHDHIADVGVLQYAMLVQNTLHETDNVLPIYGHRDDPKQFEQLTHHYTEGKEYDPHQALQVGPFTITFQKTIHPVTCYGMRITDGEHTLVYTADTSFSEEWVAFADQADLLIADTNFYEGMDGTKAGHMTSNEAAHIADAAKVSELWLSHLPHFGNVTKLKQEAENYYNGTINVAEEGLDWKAKEKDT